MPAGSLAGLAFYVVVYTLILKRRTWQNIVIGGAAGAFPPLVGWTAVTGELNPLAWLLFAIIFVWTPVHFWALALMIKDDYASANVPMLPVVKGEAETRKQILIYTLIMVAVTIGPFITGLLGGLYLASAIGLGAVFIGMSVMLFRDPNENITLRLYLYSLAYLALLFVAMAIDAVA